MTWVDAVVLMILAGSALFAFMRGFVREALGIAAWVGAGYVAVAWSGALLPSVHRFVTNPEIAGPVALGLVFIAALIVFSVAASLLARVVRLSALGGLDRTFGLLFGLVRGAALVSVAYIAGGSLFSVAQWPEPVLSARSLPYAYRGARWIAAEIPPDYTPKVEAPPAVATDSGALLQSRPHGFALGYRHAPGPESK